MANNREVGKDELDRACSEHPGFITALDTVIEPPMLIYCDAGDAYPFPTAFAFDRGGKYYLIGE